LLVSLRTLASLVTRPRRGSRGSALLGRDATKDPRRWPQTRAARVSSGEGEPWFGYNFGILAPSCASGPPRADRSSNSSANLTSLRRGATRPNLRSFPRPSPRRRRRYATQRPARSIDRRDDASMASKRPHDAGLPGKSPPSRPERGRAEVRRLPRGRARRRLHALFPRRVRARVETNRRYPTPSSRLPPHRSCWNCGLRVSECPVCRVAIQQKRRVYS